LVHVVNKRL
jgi:hypothetical protein